MDMQQKESILVVSHILKILSVGKTVWQTVTVVTGFSTATNIGLLFFCSFLHRRATQGPLSLFVLLITPKDYVE